MKPDFVSQSLWDALPDDWQEELLLESGRRFRRGALREDAFIGACDRVLADEVWRFFGADDFEPPLLWPMLMEADPVRRHPALQRAIHLVGLAKTSPGVVSKLRDEPEKVFYLALDRGPDGDCPYCGLMMRTGEGIVAEDERVHSECEPDYAMVREDMGRRVIAASLQGEEQIEEQVVEDDDVLEDLPVFLGNLGAAGTQA